MNIQPDFKELLALLEKHQVDGVGFTEAKKQRVRGKYGDVDMYFIGKEDLIKNKRATPRTKDKVDAEEIS